MSTRKAVALAVLVVLSLTLAACYRAPVQPPIGMIYNNTTAPLFGGDGIGDKSGTAYSECVLGVAGWGDCSIQAAAKQGGISEIMSTDYTIENYLGVYQKFTTIVHGK
jgi:hypothetical protein